MTIISSDTTWRSGEVHDLANSTIQIAYGATLTIEGGVEVKNGRIQTFGTLNVVGNATDTVRISNVHIKNNGPDPAHPGQINISYANLSGGSILAPGGDTGYGSLNLRDSLISGASYMYLWSPTSDVHIERNIFNGTGGISAGHSDNHSVYIKNNVFYGQTTDYAIQNWSSSSGATIVEENSFLSTDRVALMLPNGYTRSAISAVNNYFGTDDVNVINKMIFDKNDDLNSPGIISTSHLSAPAANTPKFSFDNIPPFVSVANPVEGGANFAVGGNLATTFNEAIQMGEGNIRLKTANGISIASYNAAASSNLSVSGSTLTINPTDDLAHGTEYELEFEAGTIKDLVGNPVAGKIGYHFTTLAAPALPLIASKEIEGGKLVLELSASQWSQGGNSLQFTLNYNPATATWAGAQSASSGAYLTAMSVSEIGSIGSVKMQMSTGHLGDDPELLKLAFQPTGASNYFAYTLSNISVDGVKKGSLTDTLSFENERESAEHIVGDNRHESIYGADGDDTIVGGPGDDSIDGGSAIDIAVYNGNLASYSLKRNGSTCTVVDRSGKDGSDLVKGVESLQFSDFVVNLAVQSKAAAAVQADVQRVMELYVAFFNRVPDGAGMEYWIDQLTKGQSTLQIADSFYGAGIQYGSVTGFSESMSNADFINKIYKNTLGRKDGADEAGLAYWEDRLQAGGETRGSLVEAILGAAHSYKKDATWGWVADLLDNKLAVAKTFSVDWGLGYLSPEDSITKGMAISAAVTATDTSAALSLVGISAADMSLG